MGLDRRSFLKGTAGASLLLLKPSFANARKAASLFVPRDSVEDLITTEYENLKQGKHLVLYHKHEDDVTKLIQKVMNPQDDTLAGGRYFTRDSGGTVREYPGGGAYNLYILNSQAHIIDVPTIQDLENYRGQIPWTINGVNEVGGKIDRTWGYHGAGAAPEDARTAMATEYDHTIAWRTDGTHEPLYGEEEFLGYTWVDEDDPLPITLSTFSATGGDRKVDLDWRVESEVSNYGFNLYRRRKDTGEQFRKINPEIILGRGNASSPKDYNWVDDAVINDITYEYAISDVDLSGGETVHGSIAEATPTAGAILPTSASIMANYPNPFNPQTTLEFFIPEDGQASLRVYNITGQLVDTIFKGKGFTKGPHEAVWQPGSNLASGEYIFLLDTPFNSSVYKGILLK